MFKKLIVTTTAIAVAGTPLLIGVSAATAAPVRAPAIPFLFTLDAPAGTNPLEAQAVHAFSLDLDYIGELEVEELASRMASAFAAQERKKRIKFLNDYDKAGTGNTESYLPPAVVPVPALPAPSPVEEIPEEAVETEALPDPVPASPAPLPAPAAIAPAPVVPVPAPVVPGTGSCSHRAHSPSSVARRSCA